MHDPIRDRPIGEERCEAPLACVEQRRLARNVEEALELTCEARGRQILRCRARTHSDIAVLPPETTAEFAIRHADSFGDIGRPCACNNGVAYGLTRGSQRDLTGRERRELGGEDRAQTVRVEECPVGRRRRREAGGGANARIREGSRHLPQRCILAANLGQVSSANVREPSDIATLHGSTSQAPRRSHPKS